ncbi:hypothetical protein [uncultured Tenacibaculum sp.]|uniref:DUF7005 family protein n=1 Tax=uncultured Tenacibaculum sp. TaxID=174713 RepID=UPI002624DB8E|nr:hypothetical protein [uncultured Tenacibaculum sp.]
MNNKAHDFLRGLTNNEEVIQEVFEYTQNKFVKPSFSKFSKEEKYIETWEAYNEESKLLGVFKTLKKYIVQLQFPVKAGISSTEAYKNVTLRGKENTTNSNLLLEDENALWLDIYESKLIGKVPVLIVSNVNDFKTLVCAFSNKNEPADLPKSMGAAFIKGINNWDRISKLKKAWQEEKTAISWNQFFKQEILPNRDLYQDKLIILSTKPYSGVAHEVLNVSESLWQEASVDIRKEHESAHLFTLNYYGQMAKNIHDELIADYAGIIRVSGKFDKNWMLHFLGLESYPNYRNGGRFQNYMNDNCSSEAFKCLVKITKKAIDTIQEFDSELGNVSSEEDRLSRIKSICEVDILSMASDQGKEMLSDVYRKNRIINEAIL